MITINGFFDPRTFPSAPGYVNARVLTHLRPDIPQELREWHVCFEIHTGVQQTILLDQDFLDLVDRISPIPLRTAGAALRWVLTAHAFFRPASPLVTAGGTISLFRICNTSLWLADDVDPNALGERELKLIYGGFSSPFLYTSALPFRSILGREVLARTSGMWWNRLADSRREINILGA